MKAAQGRAGRFIVTIAVALVIAGCGASQGSYSPSGSAITTMSGNARHLDGASTEVDISNDWTASIAGTASTSDCWTIMPPLPIVGAGDTAGPITITYHASTVCGIPASIGVKYGPAAFTGPQCTFNVLYDVNFSFSVTQGTDTACKILYPPLGVNAIFVYAQDASGSGHSVHPFRIR